MDTTLNTLLPTTYYERNKQKCLTAAQAYYQANKEKCNAYQRDYYQRVLKEKRRAKRTAARAGHPTPADQPTPSAAPTPEPPCVLVRRKPATVMSFD